MLRFIKGGGLIRAFRYSIIATALFTGLALASTVITIPRAQHSPAFDEALSDPEWHQAQFQSFTDFTTRQPASDSTTAAITADGDQIYIAFVCKYNSPLTLSDNLNDLRAQIIDFVEFDFDPSGNGSRIYRFLASPNGLRTQFSTETNRYYPKWSSRGLIQPSSYAVELIVPYRAMKLTRALLRNPRINFIRHIAASGSSDVFSYDARVTDLHGDSRYWPQAQGLRPSDAALRGLASADLYGLETFGAERYKVTTPGGSVSRRQPRIAGVDFSLPLTSTLSFVGTLAPDFSNVDVDQTTIAPQKFPFKYREYRPFFARGQFYVAPLPFSGIGQTSADLFYTPRLSIVDRGAKVEGTVGQSAIGILTARGPGYDDTAAGYQFSTRDQSLSFALQTVYANHSKVLDRSAGASLTLQNPGSGFFGNLEYLVDRRPGIALGSTADTALAAAGIHNAVWLAEIGYQSVGPQFAPVDGFVTNSDIRGPFYYVSYARPTKGLRQLSLLATADRFINWGRNAAQSDALEQISVQTKSLITVGVFDSTTELAAYEQGFPTYLGREDFLFNQMGVFLNFGDGTAHSLDLSYSAGRFAVSCGSSAVCRDAQPTGLVQAFVQQPSITTSQKLGKQYAFSLQLAGTMERSLSSAAKDSQWLRRISISRALGGYGAISVSLRSISGRGGNATPGTNLSALADLQFANLDHLYVEFGTPSSNQTINRYLFKYVFHIGEGAGI